MRITGDQSIQLDDAISMLITAVMKLPPTPAQALSLALEQAGTQMTFAAICGVSQAAVSKWTTSGKWLPPQHVLRVEAATGVSRHLLRPDIYPVDATKVPAPRRTGIDPYSGLDTAIVDRGCLRVAFNGLPLLKDVAA